MDLALQPQDIFLPQRPIKTAAQIEACMYEAATAYSVSSISITKNDNTIGH